MSVLSAALLSVVVDTVGTVNPADRFTAMRWHQNAAGMFRGVSSVGVKRR